jgi:ATP:ADP antiporter, AAA family
MNRATVRLTLSRTLKVYRGEGGRVTAFLVLHILISLVIGMVSTVVDALTVGRSDSGGAYLLYGTSAVLLAVIGIVYAGITDRSDKRRVLTRILFISGVICIGGSGLLFLASGDRPAAPVLAGLFMWRFIIGIVLLMVFWDLVPFYFNARQGKRLFPLLAMGGAIGYSLGSLAAAGLTSTMSAGLVLLVIAGGTFAGAVWFQGVRRSFSILDSPRYRDRSILSEVQEGYSVFRGNAFLRAVALNTLLFGVLSGLIVFTYNAVVTARTSGAGEAAGLMGYQRAAVTVLQAVVLTKVMSQSAVGGKGTSSLIQQVFFLVLGTLAFAVSMVGVADFTRQIEVALMSPAAMAAFAFLPGRYRGRVMVLNNMVAVAGGILLATIFVAAVAPLVNPLWFVYPIGFLMLVRIGFGAVLNRRYTALLSESIVADNKLNLARIEENTSSFVRDDALLARLGEELSRQSDSVRVFVLGRLARGSETVEDIRRVEPFFRDGEAEIMALWIETLARVDFNRYRDEIARAVESPSPQVRRAAQFVELRSLFRQGESEEFTRRLEGVTQELKETESGESFRDVLDLLLRLEEETGVTAVSVEWDDLPDDLRNAFLEAVSIRPRERYFPLLVSLLADPSWTAAVVPVIAALPTEFLVQHRDSWNVMSLEIRLELLRAFPDPVLLREESLDLLASMLQDFPDEPEALLIRHGERMIETAMVLLSDPAPVPPGTAKSIGQAGSNLATLFPELFRLRFAAEETAEGVRPLTVKTAREHIDRLALLTLLFHSLNLAREDDRVLAHTVCLELSERTAAVQHNTLEFIESKLDGEMRTYLLTYYENLTVEEKQSRLRAILRKSPGNVKDAVDRWRKALLSAGEELTAEIYGYFIPGKT